MYINYGNQPSMETPWLFNYAGAPWLTQHWTRQIIDKVYSGISPQEGYSGDEDQGLMGSLAVLLKTGIFSTDGGTAEKPFYEITSPLFSKIKINLNSKYYSGKSFTIQTQGSGRYIQSAKLNGSTLDRPWMWHETVAKGGNLTLQMGEKPNKAWGARPQDAPPSMSN